MIDKLIVFTACEDGACCCIPPRSAVAMISLLSMVVCMVDMSLFKCDPSACCNMKQYVECARHVLTTLFQVANVLLTFSAIAENSMLVTVYIWYTLSYVMLGLCLSLIEMLCKMAHEGETSIVVFGTEVAFYFVMSRCLPIVNSYKQRLDEIASRNTFQ